MSILKNVTKLDLSFDRCAPEIGKGFTSLFQNLKFLEKLTDLKLNLCGFFEIEENAITKLGFAFCKFTLLGSLELSFFSCKIKDKGLETLGSFLGRLTSLKTFKLDVGIEDATDLGIQKLAAGFSKLRQMEELRLTFDWSENITGQGLTWIASSLEKLEKLNSFKLKLGRLKCFQDQLFVDIGRSLSQNQSISDLEISFNEFLFQKQSNIKLCSCRNITEKGLLENTEYLIKMKNLIYLKFDCNQKILPLCEVQVQGLKMKAKVQTEVILKTCSYNDAVLVPKNWKSSFFC